MRRLMTFAIALTTSVLTAACSTSQDAGEALEKSAAGARATTQPAATQTSASPLNNYGAERFRAVNQADEIVSTLKNGMVVIAKRVPSPVVTVRAYVYTGGVYEGRWLGGGLSHLLEHLVAGGSTKNRTEAENREILQAIGNNSNAYTTNDHTAYFINTTPEHMEKAVDLVAGYMFGALITEDEYKREYEVVQRELERGKGEPGRQFYYLGALNRYRVNPARVPVIGYQEVIQGLSRDDVYEYYKLTYQPNNMVFTIVGDLPPEKMLAAVQKYAADAAPGREFIRDIPPEPPVVAPRTVVATFPKLGPANLQIAFPTVSLNHPDLYALDLLSAVLSNGESSILVEEIRDKRRLVSGIGTSSDTPVYADGSFEVEMRLDPDNIDKATDAVLAELNRVATEGVSEARLARAKVLVRTDRVKSQQTAEQIAASMAIDFMNTGDPHFTDRYVKRIGETTAEEVQAVAKKYFDRSKLLTTVMLPAEYVGAQGLPKAEDLIRAVAPTTAPAPEVAETKITRTELSNGTILLHKRITTSPLVVMHMYALGGLTAEDVKTNGIGNLTMNLLPRGTTTRSAQEIAEFFDSIGGDLGTGCGNNSWYWTATTMKDDIEQAMEVYADVVQNPAFPEDEIAPMKKRIAAAIAGQDADWRGQAFRFFKQKYFGPTDSPYQFQTIGTIENVTGFTREQIQQWYKETILPSRRVVAIFGDIELDRARSLAEAKLGNLPEARGGSALPPPQDAPLPSAEADGTAQVVIERVETQKTEQPLAGVVIGFQAEPVIGEPANYPLVVADTMTSGFGYPTGYLHETLRGRGLVYEVHALNQVGLSEKLPGTFLAYAGCEPSQVNQVVDLMLENIARLQGRNEDMDATWFARSKQLAITTDAMSNETPAEQASTAALDELYGLGYNYHDFFGKRVNAVSLDEVRGVAKNRLVKCVVTVSTPLPDLVSAKPGKRTYDNFHPVDLTPKAEERAAPQ
ncbi:MAG TPA: pitrilysin family protein [Tepidisphaeraceae bacterium]|nr:pitrilysin family protein [Tepidisphaeraceae bacterium]